MIIQDGMNRFERFIKRMFDFLFSLVGLILLSPVFLLVCISLLLQNKGSVIFSQERIGYKGKPFKIFKFRTKLLNNFFVVNILTVLYHNESMSIRLL